jgi:hypothetical protein
MKHSTFTRDLAESKDREQLRGRIQRLIDKWLPILGVHLNSWDLREMKTYWGSTNRETKHIMFNPELAKLPSRDAEYLVVHELMHLRTDGHDKHFYELMDRNLPGWRKRQARIEEPLSRYS